MSASKQQKERDKAVSHLFDFIEKSTEWSPLFEDLTRQMMWPVANHVGQDVELVTNRLFDGHYGGMAYGFLMDLMAVTTWNNSAVTPIDAFLKNRGWREGSHGRHYLRSLNEADHTFMEVTNVEPGRWVELRSHGTTETPIRIIERSASESLHRYDAIIARVVSLGKSFRFSTVLPLSAAGTEYLTEQLNAVPEDLSEWYREAVDEDGPDGLVENFADDIPGERQRRLTEYGFMCWATDVLDPPSMATPQLHNTDDERIVMTKFRFPVTGDTVRIRESLMACTALNDEGDDHWSWLKSDSSNTVLGRIKIDNNQLIFDTNSVERGERGVAFVQSLLGDALVGQPIGLHENIEDLVSSAPAEPPSSSSIDLQQQSEVQAMLQEVMKGHYRKTLDEPIPMLDNESPRACAANPDKHQKVVGWLKYLENTESKSSNPAQDFSWMWDELGLTHYR